MTGFFSPDGLRKSRLHDEKGNRVTLGGLIYAPLALWSAAAKRLWGHRPCRPMISYRAQAVLAARMRPDWQVVEFGSGMSTPWLAARCGTLVSFEDDPQWAERVRALLAEHRLTNVRHVLRPSDDFADLSDIPDGSIHLAFIDGTDRDGCARAVLPKMRPGGLIYLDNSDKDMTSPAGDLRRAEAVLRAAAQAGNWPMRTFTDFSPTNFFAEQGLMIEIISPMTIAPSSCRL